MMKARTIFGVMVMIMTLAGMTACSSTDLPVSDDNAEPTESLYGEWWLVGWNDNGTWFEVDTNYVSHRHLSIEFPEEGYVTAYSMVNEILVGVLTLDGNEMIFGGEYKGLSEMVLGALKENLFFEKHICDINSYIITGKLLRLYYTDDDYFVFTKDFDNSEEFFYAWKNGPADAFIGEVTAMSNEEVEVKVISSPSYVSSYSRAAPPDGNRETCHFAAHDLAGLSFEIGDKIAFRIVQYRRLNYYGTEYLLKVEPCKGSGQIINKTGTIYKDKWMGWIIIDDEVKVKQYGTYGIYYYPLKALPEAYLADGYSVKYSGKLYPTWRFPSVDNDNSDGYYIDIDAIELLTPPGPTVAIDEVNFPDATFREWLMTRYKWANDGLLTEKEIEEVTSIEVVGANSLKGIELLPNLTSLKATRCYFEELDLSKNTKLVNLNLEEGKLKSIDLSKNTELVDLNLSENHLPSIDLSNNTKLKYLNFGNVTHKQLNAIDLSKNTELEEVHLGHNKLTSLDLTGLKKLAYIDCHLNQIKGEAMDALIASLSSDCPNIFCAIDTNHRAVEKNVITKSQVAAAKAKGWTVQEWASGHPKEYLGSDE